MFISKQNGFSIVEALLILMIVGMIGFTGWYVWNSKQNVNKTTSQSATDSAPPPSAITDVYKTGIVTFKHASLTPDSTKKEILTKVAEPYIYYEKNDLKSDLTGVTIEVGMGTDNLQRSPKWGYDLLVQRNHKKTVEGFAFGETGKINYWFPGLCGEEPTCKPYPSDLKQKYPANYQAYLDAQNVKK